MHLIAESNTGSNLPVGYMGRLSALLDWHESDPVDDHEHHRNDVVAEAQGNRNPFVDHPEYVSYIFADGLKNRDDRIEGSPSVEETFQNLLQSIQRARGS